MGKSGSAQQQVTEYLLSVQIGVGYSLDAITGIYVNEKEAWTGESTTLEEIQINQPQLFGGPQQEGGLQGYVVHLPGRDDQVMPDNLAARFGLTSETCPANRGTTTLFFVGGGAVTRGASDYGQFGDSQDNVPLADQGATNTGFSWSYNNPAIAQTVWVKGRRAPGNGPGSQVILNPDLAMVGVDANGAHIVCECLTNTSWGMGEPGSRIDTDSFNAAAQTLSDEQFGLSMKWTRSTDIESFINEVLDHIQATLFLNPRTGLWTLKLYRDDYDISQLVTIDPSNAVLTNYQKALWGEAGNQVVVTWTDPTTEDDATITAEDLGALNSQGGSPVSVARNYYGIRNAGLALRVAQRDVRSASAPLLSATVEVNRKLWAAQPAGVCILNWPKKKIFNLVMRITNVSRGMPGSGKMKLTLLEDVFSLAKPPVTSPQNPQGTDPGQEPDPVDAVEIITLPAYFSLSAALQTAAVDLEYPEVLAAVLADSANTDVRSYGLFAETVTPDGGSTFVSHGSKSLVGRSVLPAPYAWGAQTQLDDGLVLNRVRGPQVGGFVFFGAGSDANMEIAQVISFDKDTRKWTLSRGILDTVPRSWSTGTPIWFVNPGTRIVDEVSLKSAGEMVDYKLLTRTSKGVLALADADTVVETMTARPHLPLRPANVKVNGHAAGSFDGGAVDTLSVTWATRNRTLEDGQVVAWDAGTIAPEYEQATVVTVFDQDGHSVYEQRLWTEQSLDLMRSWFDRYTAITIRVTSRRRDLDSLQGYEIGVTGLANNPAAPLPPEAPDPGPAPSPDPAPIVGAWAATGTEFTLAEGGEVQAAVPAILVSGARDRVTAVGLIVRYAKTGGTGDPDWFYLPEVALDDQPTQSATTAVSPGTQYDVQVAYQSASNILSEWRDLGNVTTGQVIANQVTRIGGYTAQEAVDAIEAIAALGDGSTERAKQRLEDLRSGNTDLAVSAFWAAADLAARRNYTDLRTQIDGGWIGTYVKQQVDQISDDISALVTETDTLGVAVAGANASILDAKTIAASGDEALADLITAAEAQIGSNYAEFLDEKTLNVTKFDAEATARQALAVTVGNVSSSVTTEATARASGDSANASLITSLSATVGSLSGSVTTYASAVASLSDGVELIYGFALDSNGHVVGLRAGISGGVGSLLFVSDEFGFVDESGANPKYVFAYDGTDIKLVNTVIDGSLLVHGTITGDKIVGGAVTTITTTGDTGPNTALSTGSAVEVASLGVTSLGGAHQITVEVDVHGNTADAGVVVQLKRDGTNVGQQRTFPVPGSFSCGRTMMFYDTPGAATHTYSVVCQLSGGSGGGVIAHLASITSMELKK